MKDRDKQIAELYASGLTLQAIGDRYGITRERVRQVLERLGVSRRGRKPVKGSRRAAVIALARDWSVP